MMSTMLLLSMLLVQDPPKLDVENTKLLVYDSVRGFTLKIQNDGKVELTVREDGKKTLAASAAEFRTKHPELVRKYELGRYLGAEPKPIPQDQFEQWWEKLKKGIPDPGPVPGLDLPLDDDLQKLLEEELNRARRPFRRAEPPPDPAPPRQAPIPGGRELGVKVQDVGETLRDQLSLKENEGVLVTEVKPGSVAEKAGIKEHDILLKLEGKAVTDRWQFRADVLTALGRPEFDLEILRAGKKSTVKVKP
jgi:hypothetical protein